MASESGQSFVVLKDLGENQCLVFGRNSVNGGPKVPEVVYYPASTSKVSPNYISTHSDHEIISKTTLQCPSVAVEEAPSVAVILNRTIRSWGADSGANALGVTISVSWATNEKDLLATDLAR